MLQFMVTCIQQRCWCAAAAQHVTYVNVNTRLIMMILLVRSCWMSDIIAQSTCSRMCSVSESSRDCMFSKLVISLF